MTLIPATVNDIEDPSSPSYRQSGAIQWKAARWTKFEFISSIKCIGTPTTQQHNIYFQPQSPARSQQHTSGILVINRVERQEDNEFSIDRQFQLLRKAEDVEQRDGFTGRSVAPNGRRSKPKTSTQPKKWHVLTIIRNCKKSFRKTQKNNWNC